MLRTATHLEGPSLFSSVSCKMFHVLLYHTLCFYHCCSECKQNIPTRCLLFHFDVCPRIAGFLLGMIPPAFQAIRKAQLAGYKLYRIIDRKPTINSSDTKGKKLTTMEGRITIENMHFQYPTSATKTFEDINLEIAPGETIA